MTFGYLVPVCQACNLRVRSFLTKPVRSGLVRTRKVWGDLTSYRVGEQRHVTNEQALLERARAYDEDALGELYDEYAPLIYAYLYRRVQDAHLAEDLTSEVFVRMLQAIQARQSWHTSFRGWLYRCLHAGCF